MGPDLIVEHRAFPLRPTPAESVPFKGTYREAGWQRCNQMSAGDGIVFNPWPHDALPGWSLPALKFLYEDRKITPSGHEKTDTDPGTATTKDDYSLETYILSTNHYQIELLTNLDQAPESGALVVVSFPKPKGGSGFPARVFAILP